MELIQKLSSPILLMMLAGAFPVASASAQFVVEETPKVITSSDSTHSTTSVNTRWVQTVSDGEQVFKMKFEDGEYEITLDGKPVPFSRIKEEGDSILVISDKGETICEFLRPSVGATFASSGARFAPGNNMNYFQSSTAGAPSVSAWVGVAGDGDNNQNITIDVEQPKVMLGINMSEPGAALRKHLKLDDDRQVIMVEKVIEGLPAAKAGMESYDIIVSINDSKEASGETLHKALMEHKAGDKLKIWVLRAGEKLLIEPELVAYDGEKLRTNTFTISVDNDDTPRDLWSSNDGNSRFRVERLPGLNTFPGGAQDEKERAVLHEEMMRRAKEAIAQAERQVLELRNGQLFVHQQKADELQQLLNNKLAMLDAERAFSLESHPGLENRLDALEGRFNALEDRMEQVAGLIERMFEKMAKDDED